MIRTGGGFEPGEGQSRERVRAGGGSESKEKRRVVEVEGDVLGKWFTASGSNFFFRFLLIQGILAYYI